MTTEVKHPENAIKIRDNPLDTMTNQITDQSTTYEWKYNDKNNHRVEISHHTTEKVPKPPGSNETDDEQREKQSQ